MASTPAPPPFSPTIALLTMARSVEADLASALSAHGLTVRKYGVLGHIAASPGMSLSELARRSRITVQSTHTMIAALAEAGLASSAVPAPGLAANVTVTAEGRRVLAAVSAELADIDAATFSGPAASALADALRAVIAERVAGA